MSTQTPLARRTVADRTRLDCDYAGSGCKIVDRSIDGVNQAFAERSQFGDLIARNGGGVAALITQMRTESGTGKRRH